MEIFFKPTFVKEIEVLPVSTKRKVKKLCFEIFPDAKNIFLIEQLGIKQLRGFHGYYRIKIGEYRVGFMIEKNTVVFMRAMHRKDIYKFFP